MSEMLNKPYRDMTEVELNEVMKYWICETDHAAGFASAHFAAKQCKAIASEAQRRGLSIDNPRPIIVGP